MFEQVSQLIQKLNLPPEATVLVVRATLMLALVLVAAVAFLIAKRLLLRVVSSAIKRSKTQWDNQLLEHRVFYWLAHLAPGVVLYLLSPLVLSGSYRLIAALRAGSLIYMIVVAVLAIDALINAVLEIYNGFDVSKQVPLKGFTQVAKILLYLAALVVILATLLGKSPFFLLSGMGILASVLMLVFKDPILGLVAGIQLSTNRMLSKGDWISMSSYGADGDVIDIALTTVKVQNWDKTITTIPTYALISDSFKNWRGMEESGGRRISRSVHIDKSSIRFCTPEMLVRFAKIQYIAAYIEESQEQLAAWNAEHGIDDTSPVNGRRLTNVGIFRAYLLAYLRNHPGVNQEMTLLVRQLEPTPDGLPIQIYCFSSTTEWAAYENLQSDIFDHILAVATEFDLRLFQNPSGGDFQRLSG